MLQRPSACVALLPFRVFGGDNAEGDEFCFGTEAT